MPLTCGSTSVGNVRLDELDPRTTGLVKISGISESVSSSSIAGLLEVLILVELDKITFSIVSGIGGMNCDPRPVLIVAGKCSVNCVTKCVDSVISAIAYGSVCAELSCKAAGPSQAPAAVAGPQTIILWFAWQPALPQIWNPNRQRPPGSTLCAVQPLALL